MPHTNDYTDPLLAQAQADLDALAATYNLRLRIEHDPEAPMAFAVWCWGPEETRADADIAGAGEDPGEAVEQARAQLRLWHE
jgi:hypothetical protein